MCKYDVWCSHAIVINDHARACLNLAGTDQDRISVFNLFLICSSSVFQCVFSLFLICHRQAAITDHNKHTQNRSITDP